ncbi:hypothetical protein DFH08DRAFT_972903 [Mycena albidolilacea]|uniref:N-acetyltransferase domain-containing protein n=1 Tax=Mycena albidolilacea TaxID=1033008 RepID=A0AAD7ED77_9AGAR|nr:hypothetical protein DFH08DRAFT_972903 [Mycena albidolilacea]
MSYPSPRCCAFTLGLGGLCSGSLALRIAGTAFSTAATALLICARRSITGFFVNFCAIARETDIADIARTYGVPLSAAGTHSAPEPGPSGFWVAATESQDRLTSEVVGFLGLDHHANVDLNSSVLRRLVVSPHHRRRKIGTLLLAAVLDYVHRLAPPLEILELEMSEFQPGARRLYEKHGFSLVETRVIRTKPLFSLNVLRLRKRLAAQLSPTLTPPLFGLPRALIPAA